jgi:aryl-alcohol dehydrogenase-like predicted oxidoreductase
VSTPGGLVYRGRPEQIREDCERSLRRLHVDVIALSQLHTVDPDVPIEESIGGMADLKHEGKVRHLGLSNVDLGQLRRAQAVAPVASVQNRFSLSDRSSTNVLEICAAEGIAFLPWRPLAHDGLTAAGEDALVSRLWHPGQGSVRVSISSIRSVAVGIEAISSATSVAASRCAAPPSSVRSAASMSPTPRLSEPANTPHPASRTATAFCH